MKRVYKAATNDQPLYWISLAIEEVARWTDVFASLTGLFGLCVLLIIAALGSFGPAASTKDTGEAIVGGCAIVVAGSLHLVGRALSNVSAYVIFWFGHDVEPPQEDSE